MILKMHGLLSTPNYLAFFGEEPPDAKAMMMLCAIPLILAFAIFFICSKRESTDKLFQMRVWLSAIPLGIGLFIGGFRVSKILLDRLYQQYFQIGTNMMILHYGAVLLPILGLAGIFFWNRLLDRQAKYDF